MPNFRHNRANVEIFIWIVAFVVLYGLVELPLKYRTGSGFCLMV